MFQKQSMTALHAQGVSNRQIAKLLSLDRDTVSRHVRLLKPQNQPGAPSGDDAGISPSGRRPAGV
jgi:IS30 family transposase